MLLYVASYLVDGGFVGYCYGEVHDCGPAQDTDGGVGVPVLEGGALGDRGAAAEGDADAGDHAGAVAGQSRHDAGGDADDAKLGGLQGDRKSTRLNSSHI